MGLKRLLDTNAYVALKRGHAGVAQCVRDAEELIFSVFVLGELFFGFQGGSRFAQNAKELDELLNHPFASVAPATRVTADRFGRLASRLKRLGHPIPTNDIWIAAHCMETGAELITFDRHFRFIENLAATILEP